MRTDKELLELAAKAAGVKIDKSPYNGGGRSNTGFDIAGNAIINWHNGEKWNPLADYSDALLLAAHLEVDISISAKEVSVLYWLDATKEELGTIEVAVTHTFSKDAALCRAITMAAAEIGEVT